MEGHISLPGVPMMTTQAETQSYTFSDPSHPPTELYTDTSMVLPTTSSHLVHRPASAASSISSGGNKSGKKDKKGSAGTSKKAAVPATIPTVYHEDGIEWIQFTYSVKGVVTEYRIRTDVEAVDLDAVPQNFKIHNCVYPRAFCEKEEYTGNRWDYENTVNILGWKLSYLNQDALCGKRGLIQRAVDSYRNRFPEMRSRRVVRQEKLIRGTLRKRSDRPEDEKGTPIEGESGASTPDGPSGVSPAIKTERRLSARSPPTKSRKLSEDVTPVKGRKERVQRSSPVYDDDASAPNSDVVAGMVTEDVAGLPSKKFKTGKTLSFETILEGAPVKHRIRVDIDHVQVADLPDDFKAINTVYPRVYNVARQDYTFGPSSRWEYETSMNQLGWRLAWVNASKLSGKKCLLQRAIDCYRIKFMKEASVRPRPGKALVMELIRQQELSKAELVRQYQDNQSKKSNMGSLEAQEVDAVGLLASGLSKEERLAKAAISSPSYGARRHNPIHDVVVNDDKTRSSIDEDTAAELLQNFYRSA